MPRPTYSYKDWQNTPSTATPINATALDSLEHKLVLFAEEISSFFVLEEQTRAVAAEDTKLIAGENLADVVSAFHARTNLGLGTAATAEATDFDPAGAAAAAITVAEAAAIKAVEEGYIPISERGAAGGVAALGEGKSLQVAEGESSGLPLGKLHSHKPGLQILSSHPSDDVSGGTDGTGRLYLYSYQRAHENLFGEVIRAFLMRKDAKACHAWYGPKELYDSERNPVGTEWQPWAWAHAHYEADNDAELHCHWEVEVPDSTGALQGRLQIRFAETKEGPNFGKVGLDHTTVTINQADLSIFGSTEAKLVLGGGNTHEKIIEWNNDEVYVAESQRRWRLLANTTTEAGGNVGTDLALRRYSDSGAFLGTPLFVARSTGRIATGQAEAGEGRITAAWGEEAHGFQAKPSAAFGTFSAFDAYLKETGDRAYQVGLQGESNKRLTIFASGKLEWGSGTETKDTNLYRSSAEHLKTDQSLVVAKSLTVGASPSGEAIARVVQEADKPALELVNLHEGGNVSGALILGETETATSIIEMSKVVGDSVNRYSRLASGKQEWGSGTEARDVNLYRSSAAHLKTDQNLTIGEQLTVGATPEGEAKLRITQTTAKTGLEIVNTAESTGNPLVFLQAKTSSSAGISARVEGDTSARFTISPSGKHEWGPGNAGRDTTLERFEAEVLKTTTLQLAKNLRINTTSVASGVGVIAIANAGTNPSGVPTGGGVLFCKEGGLWFKGSSGTETKLAAA